MKFDPFKHRRHSIRLKDYDYSREGAYYVTTVAQNRLCLFGDVVNAEMILNDAGEMLQSQWRALPERFPNIELDEFVVMPNHFHGIVVMTDKTGRATTRVAPTRSDADISVGAGLVPAQNDHDPVLGEIIGAWKSITTDEYIRGVHELNWEPFNRKLWQRNYWEHIIRDEKDLNRIRKYIIDNPANWNADAENLKNANATRRGDPRGRPKTTE